MNKKYLAVLLALVVSLSVSVGVFAQDPFAVTWDEETVLTFFNDVNLVFPDMFAPEDSDYLWTEDDTETIPNFDLHAKDVSAEEVDLEAKTGIGTILKVKATADPCGDGLIKVDVEFSKDPAASGPKKTTYIRSIGVKWGSNYLDIVKCESTGADSCRSVKFNNKGIAKMTLYVYSDAVIDDSISDLGSVTVTLDYSEYMTALFPVPYSTVSGNGKLTRDMKKNYCQAHLTEFDPRTGKSVSAVRAKYDQNTGEARFQATIANISGGKNEVFKSYFMIPAEIMVDYKKDGLWYTSHYKDYTCKYTIYNNFNGAMMTLPLMNFPGWTASSRIYLSMLYNNEDMMAEFTNNGMVFYAAYMCPGYQFYSTKEITATDPSAFNGLTVMCDQPQMASFINQNQGGAINAFPPDYLSNLQNGVADALVQHVNCAYVFGCFDYVKSAMFFGEGGFYNIPLAYGMSETFWNSLPEDLQQIFMNHAAEFCYESQMSDEALYYNVAYPALEEHATITVLDDAAVAEWQEAVAPIVESALVNIAKDSPNADAAYAQLKDMIANYDEETFEIGANNFGLPATWGE